MNLVKTSFYTSISTAITFITGFVVTKVVAVAIGPQGMAYLGQFQNATAMFAIFGLAAINAGVIKYLAEYRGNVLQQQTVISNAVNIVLIASVLTSLIIIAFSGYLSNAVFHSPEFKIVFILYAVFLLAISLNTLSISILNGLQEIRKYTIVNICSSITGLLITVYFSYNYGLKGILLAASFSSIFVLCINLYFLRMLPGISFRPDFKRWDKRIVRLFFGFSLMTVVSGFLAPVVQMFIRDNIIRDISLDSAGHWQAVTKISDYYLGFITTVLGVYYLPRLSELKLGTDLRKEVLNGYKLILPVVGILAFVIFLCRSLIIRILFTEAFAPMEPLFAWQLLGDFFKIGSWLLAFLMLSKAMTLMFILTEIGFSVLYLILSFAFMQRFGVIGATYAFALNYAIYWVVIWLLMKKKLAKK
ncbi:MAG: O-antigen translocase [Chitinophagaceae bacterium]|nr:MAG: O-antigen translocase [Chitinophagaceae bacterium]